MDNTNCSDVQLCQDVDNQLQICLTEELKSVHSYSETLPNHPHYSLQLNAVSHPAHTVPNQIPVIGSKEQTSNNTIIEDDNFVADIELISLTSQRQSIPRYRLRVDPCTAFLGYRNKDFRSARRITRDFSSKYPLPKSSSELTTIGYISSYTTNPLQRTTELNSEEDRSEGEDENDDTLSLTTEQIENTLDYFILCGLRVSQMAQTYEDLDAITQLLEEKQTDLELAAKIGKNLLAKNHDLQSRLLETEKNLNARDEVISQLNHNLTVKDNLLRIFLRDSDQITDINDDEVSVLSSGRASPVRSQQGLSSSAGGGDGFSLSSVNFAQLHKKLGDLEEENNLLRQERNRLSTAADQLDEHETALVRDCARQLITANMHIRNLSDELAKKSDAFMNQQSEITRLLTRGLDLENRVKQLTAENEMLIGRLKETQISQSLLTSELKNLRDKYDECLTLYNEARLEIRGLRKRSRRGYYRPNSLISSSSVVNTAILPSLPPSYLNGAALTPQSDQDHLYHCHHSSLSAHQLVSDGSTSSLDMLTTQNPSSDHLETSLAADLVHAKMKEHAKDNMKHLFRAMDQVRHTHTLSNDPTTTPTATTTINFNNDDNSSHNITLIESGLEDTVSSSGFVSGSEPSDNPHKQRFVKSEQTSNSGSPYSTRPFIPDFVSPIHLAHAERSKSDAVNYRFHQSTNPNYLLESEKRHSWLGCDVTSDSSEKGYYLIPDSGLNFQNSFDDSLLSCDPNVVCTSKAYCKLPQRLKLIKPLDGSNVLQHWQHLATPSFTRALFDAPLPGVQSRAGVSDSTNTNCLTMASATDSRQRPVSVGSSPCISNSSQVPLKCSSLTAHSPSDLPHGQPNMRLVQESLEKCTNLNRFGFSSSTCFLNNGLRTRSLDHLVAGSSSSSYNDKDSNNKFIQFNQPFDHAKSDESASSSYLTSFSLTSLVSALLPFTTTVLPSSVSSFDPKGVTINNKLTKTKTQHGESTHIRSKCPSSSSTAATGLQGLLDVNKEYSDSSKSLLHRTSTSKSIDRSALSPNSNAPNPIALPNPQPPTLISPSVNRTTISHSRPVRTSNLTEITEESSSPPKSENGQKSLIYSENQKQSRSEEVVVVPEKSKNSK